mgnify:CR=1 FL=1
MRYLLIVLCLSGCASLEGQFSNRPVCMSDEKSAYNISFWTTWLGIASQIDKRDVSVICKKVP